MIRFLTTSTIILIFWQLICIILNLPPFILPTPYLVGLALIENYYDLFKHTQITLLEIILSLIFGILIGSIFAILVSTSNNLKRWLMPILLSSQAIPVFALAPILVLWLGYGITSKIVIGTIIVFFPTSLGKSFQE